MFATATPDSGQLRRLLDQLTADAAHNASVMERCAERELALLTAEGLAPLLMRLTVDLRASFNLRDVRLALLDPYNVVRDLLGSLARPYPGIGDLLERLQQSGIGWGIATNKPRQYTEPLLERLDIQPPPGSVVCPDDVTDRKPHPESLYLNCRELGCAPHQAIYVGDHQRDIEAGRRAGMYTVAAAYGYIEPDDDPNDWGADALAACSTHLPDLILD